MPNFKDPQNKVYFLSAEDITNGGEKLLPAGCVQITDAEYQAIVNPTPTLDQVKATKIAEANHKAQAIADQLTAGYPEFEKTTWPDQQAEALAWDADNTKPTPYIDGLALQRGIDRVTYLQKTVAKVNAYRDAAQKLVGQRQKYVDQVNAAATREAVEAIQIAYSLS